MQLIAREFCLDALPLPQTCLLSCHDIHMMDCAFNYVVTAHKPTNVTHSTVGHFTSAQDINLIISCVLPIVRMLTRSCCSTKGTLPTRMSTARRKCTRIEIHRLTPDGLQVLLSSAKGYLLLRMLPKRLCVQVLTAFTPQGVADVPLYGRIATLELFRPPVSPAVACADHGLVHELSTLRCQCQSARWEHRFWPAVAKHSRTRGVCETQEARLDARRARRRICCSFRRSATSSACWSGTAAPARSLRQAGSCQLTCTVRPSHKAPRSTFTPALSHRC